MVTSSKKIWKQAITVDENELQALANELEVSRLFVEVCFQRGLTTKEAIQQFIQVDETWFHDPYLLYDMERVIERITEAIENFEQITIYGDYDADGMTSTSLLYETLESIGANVNYYLPSRFKEGYGPNSEAFETLINNGTSLIITVDNGVAGHEAIKHATKLGADVIVTDHHELPSVLPEAYAIIHPKHPDGNYPFPDLAGVGVALKVAHALIGELPIESLDLAALGTVADLVPLLDENRAIVYFGLKMLEQTQRVGLLQLYQLLDKKPSEITEETIGFQIAPRLNAVGRLGEASPCVELLTTFEPSRAKELVRYVDEQNTERKQIVEDMTKDVVDHLEEMPADTEVVVLADENWHQGVLGIVASRVVEKTGKPTLLFTIDANTGIAKGSARSVEGFDLYNAFEQISELFTQFGGHSMAAGISAEVTNLPEIQMKLSTILSEMEDFELTQKIDTTLPLSDMTTASIKEVMNLRPFGTGNEKPLVASETVSVLQKRGVGVDGAHLKLLIGQNEEQLDIISFQNGYMTDLLFEGQEIAVVGYLEINEWNGNFKPQMQMIDIDIPGPMLVDQRINQLTPTHLQKENTTFVFYNAEVYKTALKNIPESSEAILLRTAKEAGAFRSEKEIVIVDCPTSVEIFNETLAGNEYSQIRCYFYKQTHSFLTGIPTRDDFARSYKFFATHKDIDLVNHGNTLSELLKLDNNKIYLIVKVFLEAKFVIISNGVLNVVEHPKKTDILKTKSYQEAQEQLKAEELFLYSSFNEVIHSIT